MANVLVIGGGAAGLLAGIAAAQSGAQTVILEKMRRPGKKILITGKGRCNITNNCDLQEIIKNIPGNGRFLNSALRRFTNQDIVQLLEDNGLPTKVERGGRVFPVSDKAADVVDTLVKIYKNYGGKLLTDCKVKSITAEFGKITGAVTADGQKFAADAVILAAGGSSYPGTGSDGSGYRLARQAGHTIMPPQPSLCSLVSPDPACRRMMGLALRNVTLTLLCDGKPLFTEQGEALFTHFGLSGPLVLSASTYIEDITKHRYICEFDLKPALDEKTLYDRLTRDFAEQGSHSAQGALAKLLPNSMRPVAVEKWGIDPATKAAQITREQKQALVDLCKHWQVPVSALGDKEHAVITAGGVDVREVDPKTMASKLCAGLYFAGEVLDVDARTGGYNLQIAWSTAVAAAKAL